jgi:hypothetical protein
MKYLQALGLVVVAALVFYELASAGRLALAIAEGVILPAAVIGEWRWQATHDEDPEVAAQRMAALVIVALLGILGAS